MSDHQDIVAFSMEEAKNPTHLRVGHSIYITSFPDSSRKPYTG